MNLQTLVHQLAQLVRLLEVDHLGVAVVGRAHVVHEHRHQLQHKQHRPLKALSCCCCTRPKQPSQQQVSLQQQPPHQQVSRQLPTSADTARICCSGPGHGAVDRYFPPAGPTAVNPLQRRAVDDRPNDGIDRRTDRQTLESFIDPPECAYASSVNCGTYLLVKFYVS